MKKITQAELESHLWTASNFLRGSIDSGEYKQYIFGLLFYKRLCDVWNEEYEQLLTKHNNDSAQASHPHNHRIHIPFGCMWSEEFRPDPSEKDWPRTTSGIKIPKTIRQWESHIGQALQLAFQLIEDSNPDLKGLFQDVDFANQERFPDSLLSNLLLHFEKYRMRKSDVDSNILGNAYEYLIAKFADDAGKKGGEFYTPKEVVRLMVEILDPEENMSIYDPTCGSGGMLLECIHHMKREKKDSSTLTLYGQEKNLNTWAMCNMSMFLHDANSTIARGDTILNPKHKNANGTLQQFDIVLANPPFSLKNWGYTVWSKNGDPYQREKYGLPPKGYGDFAFIQHMIASVKKKGKIGVVLPMGILFRGSKERTIRKALIEADLIDCVVGLGPNLFYGAAIPAVILFLRKEKPKHRKNKIFFVNAEREIDIGIAQNHLSHQHIAKIVDVIRNDREQSLFSRIVPRSEIVDNDYNLNIIRYVQTTAPPDPIDIQATYHTITALKTQLDQDYQQLQSLLQQVSHD